MIEDGENSNHNYKFNINHTDISELKNNEFHFWMEQKKQDLK